jgi:hypothetical protein
MAPVRGGKSLVGDVWLPWTLANDPGPFRWVFQNDQIAKEHAELRAMPTLKSVSVIRDILPGGDSERTQEIIFKNGIPLYIQGPAINKLQSKGYRFVIADEPWLYAPGIIGEIKGRVGDFLKMHTSKILFISQGGEPDGDWDEQYKTGEPFEWHVQCQKCERHMPLKWTGRREDGSYWGMRWDEVKHSNKDWDADKAKRTAYYECMYGDCRHPHKDGARLKSEWNRTGHYLSRPEILPAKVSIRWTGIIDYPWEGMVENWLIACNAMLRGNPTLKIQFYQKYLAQSQNEQGVLEASQRLSRVIYDLRAAWPEEVRRVMTIDKQGEDVYWWSVRAWTKAGKSRRVGFGRAIGGAELEKIREDYKVAPNHTMIDSAWMPKGDRGVYIMCITWGWIAIRGDDKEFFIHKDKKGRPVARSYSVPIQGDPETGTNKRARLILFSKPTYNSRVQGLIDSGFWEEPATGDPKVEEEYTKQMAGRMRRVEHNKTTGKARVFWFETKNDHARDLANMQVLAATLSDILPDTLDGMEAKGEAIPS